MPFRFPLATVLRAQGEPAEARGTRKLQKIRGGDGPDLNRQIDQLTGGDRRRLRGAEERAMRRPIPASRVQIARLDDADRSRDKRVAPGFAIVRLVEQQRETGS
jgi:hypothetical protein